MKRRTFASIVTALFMLVGPGTVAGLIPRWISDWRWPSLGPAYWLVQIVGAIFVLAGASVLADSFVRFAWQGLGTPAPIFPTQHLVMSGLYRFVRNPMYVAVTSAILGQALLFGNLQLGAYAAVAWLCFHGFVRAYEEPKLRRTFGVEYDTFCSKVPRWIPRFTPWEPNSR